MHAWWSFLCPRWAFFGCTSEKFAEEQARKHRGRFRHRYIRVAIVDHFDLGRNGVSARDYFYETDRDAAINP